MSEQKNEVAAEIVRGILAAAGNMFTEEQKSVALKWLDHDWIPAEIVGGVLEEMYEQQGEERLRTLGRAVPYTLKPKFEAMGVNTPRAGLEAMGMVHAMVTRGPDVGERKVVAGGENWAEVEDTTLWNCVFEAGVLQGVVRVCGGKNVQYTEKECVRKGDGRCLHRFEWE